MTERDEGIKSREKFGAYELLQKIKEGGVSQVYQARKEGAETLVALKIVQLEMGRQPAFQRRWQQENHLLSQLAHPHIVPILEAGVERERPFLVMPFLSGGTLRDRLHTGKMAPSQLWVAMAQIAQALDAAHQQHLLHGDIKPSNILFDDTGNAYLTDFGLIQLAAEMMDADRVMGTPAYMSPEQIERKWLDGRSDQYGLAVVIFEAMTGRPPFVGETAQILDRQQHMSPPAAHTLNDTVSPELAAVLDKALSKNAEARFASVNEFIERLQAVNETQLVLPGVAAIDPITSPEYKGIEAVVDNNALERLYEDGRQAMDNGQWQTAFVAFDEIVQTDRYYRSALVLRREAERHLKLSSQQSAAMVAEESNGEISVPSQRTTENEAINVPPQRTTEIVAGAGGATLLSPTPPSRSRYKPIYLIVAVVFISSVMGVLWSIFNSRNQTQRMVLTATAVAAAQTAAVPTLPQPTAVTKSNAITLVSGESDSLWQVGQTRLLPDNQLVPVPSENDTLTVQTQADAVQFTLPDGTEVILAEETTVAIHSVQNIHEAAETKLVLIQGHMVAITGDKVAVIANPFGAEAAGANSILGIAYSEEPFHFTVDCLEGSCYVKGDLEGELQLSGGESSFVGGSGKPTEAQAIQYELYGWAEVIPTATSQPPSTATATTTPTATDTATVTPPPPTDTATPTATPTETPEVVFWPNPSLTRFTCSEAVDEFNSSETIPFEWTWNGRLRGSEYLEIRIGPQGSRNLTSLGVVISQPQNNAWVEFVDASRFFNVLAFDYHWEVVHMSGNGRTVLARSARGCVRVVP